MPARPKSGFWLWFRVSPKDLGPELTSNPQQSSLFPNYIFKRSTFNCRRCRRFLTTPRTCSLRPSPQSPSFWLQCMLGEKASPAAAAAITKIRQPTLLMASQLLTSRLGVVVRYNAGWGPPIGGWPHREEAPTLSRRR
jgi:hypothetical protein